MTIKKTLVLVGSLMILGVGTIFAADSTQAQAQNAVQEQVGLKFQARTLFVDENGDGICDYSRDYDIDGIPNCQDLDLAGLQEGTGYKNMNGSTSSSYQFGNRNGYHRGNSWNNQSFRQNQASFGSGICDGSGPKGNSRRSGRG